MMLSGSNRRDGYAFLPRICAKLFTSNGIILPVISHLPLRSAYSCKNNFNSPVVFLRFKGLLFFEVSEYPLSDLLSCAALFKAIPCFSGDSFLSQGKHLLRAYR